jgi:hypothetical protein
VTEICTVHVIKAALKSTPKRTNVIQVHVYLIQFGLCSIFVHTHWDNPNSGAVSQKYLLVYDNGIMIVHAVPVDQDAYYTISNCDIFVLVNLLYVS